MMTIMINVAITFFFNCYKKKTYSFCSKPSRKSDIVISTSKGVTKNSSPFPFLVIPSAKPFGVIATVTFLSGIVSLKTNIYFIQL